MASTAKVSVAIGRAELAWARAVARREGKSLSAVVTDSLAERRRLAALAEVVAWMGDGQPPLTERELDAARRALGADAGSSPARAAVGRPRRHVACPRAR